MSLLFQVPKCENRPLGVNTLGKMKREISTKAMLSKVYTKHCVRATVIVPCGLTTASSGSPHLPYFRQQKINPNSLQHFNSRPSSSQFGKCSDVLSSALQVANHSAQEFSQHFQPVRQIHSGEFSPTVVETNSRSTTTTITRN